MNYNTYASKNPEEKVEMVMGLLNKDKGTYKGINYRAVVDTIDNILSTKPSEPTLIETAQREVGKQRAEQLDTTFDSMDAAQYVADLSEAGGTEQQQLQAAIMQSVLESSTRGGGRKTRRRKSRRSKTRKNKSRRNKTRKNKRR